MLRAVDLTIAAGRFRRAGLNFTVAGGSYTVLMGATGSGKTTTLETICGLKRPAAGQLWWGDRELTRLKPGERGLGYVPQDGALFPTMTVAEQLGFALAVQGWKAAARRSRVAELAELLELTHLLDRQPQGLSGGERQRVALGRALAAEPALLCLDEPLSALDEPLRAALGTLLRSLQRRQSLTVLHVTHSRPEALALADELLLLDHDGIHTIDESHEWFRRESKI